ncbi:MAG TPA: hypothetical protein PKM27_06370 [Saprospiraceae bacterium]|nr:hypothetical protein [Saprospiraceae bacterium]HNT19873.1 hypothetical protein [Saprospiraceae bacterium]
MKKILLPALLTLGFSNFLAGQSSPALAPAGVTVAKNKMVSRPSSFVMIHKEKDSPFEIYQDLNQDELVIRLKNQFDVLRFEVRDQAGKAMPVKGIQQQNEVHAALSGLPNGTYRLIVDRNKEKIFTEFLLDR